MESYHDRKCNLFCRSTLGVGTLCDSWLATINIIVLPISTAFAEDGLYLGCGVHQIKNKYTAITKREIRYRLW